MNENKELCLMRVTGQERRDFAGELRYGFDHCRCAEQFAKILRMLANPGEIYSSSTSYADLAGLLADYIDWPECEWGDGAFYNGRNEYGFVCSNCECAFEDEAEARQWHYCPNCGAEVV